MHYYVSLFRGISPLFPKAVLLRSPREAGEVSNIFKQRNLYNFLIVDGKFARFQNFLIIFIKIIVKIWAKYMTIWKYASVVGSWKCSVWFSEKSQFINTPVRV